jgi:hypothetical protein
MPHASTYIRIANLERWGEMLQRQSARRSRWWSHVSDVDGGIGANQIWRKLKGSWMMNKRDFVALIRLILEV